MHKKKQSATTFPLPVTSCCSSFQSQLHPSLSRQTLIHQVPQLTAGVQIMESCVGLTEGAAQLVKAESGSCVGSALNPVDNMRVSFLQGELDFGRHQTLF